MANVFRDILDIRKIESQNFRFESFCRRIMSWIMEEVEILIESIQTAFSEELSKAGAAPFLEIGEARQAC